MANKILVVLEQRDNQLKKITHEVAKVGSDLANKLNCEVEAVVVGGDVNPLNKVGGFGVKKVTLIKNEELSNYSPSAYTKIISDFADEIGADILIFGNTAIGKDLAPRVSVKLDAGIAMDCVELNFSDGEIIATRPVYAGKALVDIKINSDKKVFVLRPNVFNPGESTESEAEVVLKAIDAPDLSTKVVEVKKSEGKLDVAEASIIVSGGRGMKEADNFKLVEDLAEVLGAAVGASRAVVDAGWRPHAEQVGQTGKVVSPNLYVALGISGAIQHLAGMRSSKYIVAINKDVDAPIFQVADYGITGDVFEVVPALIEELKK
ncbi:MAG: electron transfer flavoprotein subunit alpha/FixB family protein [Ignavibacteriales bacterium]|nr:electron transfer flavoprotein subunit alpha/FixB family protein [Ignavibacteriales bacterium]MCB9218409.1 electron transfer flavoprotein subunit alpha/FixB family protein [Ignavibacteriales bacterium]